jgi:nucleotide-binding universal stress UspA family protein
MSPKIKKTARRLRAGKAPAAGGKARRGPALRLIKILVPVDFSDCSRKALEYALPFARQFHAGITLLHIVHVNYYAANSEYTTFDYPELIEETGRAGKKQLDVLARSIARKCQVTTLIQTGHPGSIIVDTAKRRGIDLIIISTHGRTGFKRAFLGSTAEYAVRYAPCPVLIVREHEHEFVQHQPIKFRRSRK